MASSRPTTTTTTTAATTDPSSSSSDEDDDATQNRIPLSAMTEADEIYERIDELKADIIQATDRVAELDGKLADLRNGLGDMNELMDLKNLRSVCHGRLGLIQHAVKAAEVKLASISNATRSLLVKSLASLRSVMYHKLKREQIQYSNTRSERVKRERDETERRLISTTEALTLERKGQSQSEAQLVAEYQERVAWLVSGDTKTALGDLNNSHFVTPRAFDETARIEKFMSAGKQQGTGAKMILLLKHMQLNPNEVYTLNLSHNNLGNWSNLVFSTLSHSASVLQTLCLRGCRLDDECLNNLCLSLPGNAGTLTNLDLSKNNFTSAGVAELGRCLSGGGTHGGRCCGCLTRVDLGDNNISNDGTEHSGVEYLSLGLGGGSGEESGGTRSHVVHVRLQNASIYSDGTKRLAPLNWRWLLSVDLSYNYLTNRGALAIGTCGCCMWVLHVGCIFVV